VDRAGVFADQKPFRSSWLSGQRIEMTVANNHIDKPPELQTDLAAGARKHVFAFQPHSRNSPAVRRVVDYSVTYLSSVVWICPNVVADHRDWVLL
jgi:hypothetical protein